MQDGTATVRERLDGPARSVTPRGNWRNRGAGPVLGLGAMLLSAGLTGAAAAAPEGLLPPEVRVETLDNGLQVVVLPLPGFELVALQTWVRAGSGRELRAGETGYAHFFEHLMFHGTQTVPREEREQRLVRLGVTENAWTSADATVYHLLARADRLPALLELESDRFAHLSLTAAGVRKEAGAVQGEMRKGKANPDRAAMDGLMATAFRVHPYHHSTIGLDADVAGMGEGLTAAQDFFASWYRPDNLTVVVAGGIDAEVVLADMRRTWGQWKAPPRDPPKVPVEPAQDGLRRAQIVWDQGPANTRLAIGWRVPAFVPGARESAALALLPELLASKVAPLHRKLVEEERLANWVYMEAPEGRDPGLAFLLMELRDGVDPAVVEDAVLEAIAELKEDGPELSPRVRLAASRAGRSAVLTLDSPDAWASALGNASLYRGNPLDVEPIVAALGAVRADDVRAAARRYLVPDQCTILTLVGPDQAVVGIEPPPIGPELPAPTAGGAR